MCVPVLYTEAKDETNQVMNEVKKVSHKVHGGLKRMSHDYHVLVVT